MRRLTGCDACQVGDKDPACFRLPPGVDDRAATSADIVVKPMPGFFIDRLTDRAQHFQRTEILVLHKVKPKTHQASDGRRGRIKDVHFEFVYDVPETAGIGPGRDPFEKQGGGTRAQRTIYDIAMTGDPADVGCTEMDIPRLILK